MKNFYHVKFMRNLKNNNFQKLMDKGVLTNYLIFDYFDYLIFEKSDDIQACAFGERIEGGKSTSCEAYQGLGLFCEEIDSSENKRSKFVKCENPIELGNENIPFLSIFQLTINPYFYKHDKMNGTDDLIENIQTLMNNIFSESTDQVYFQIYQTVNTIDFCVIVVSEKLSYIETLSSELKKLTFCLDNKKYIAFTVYENIGLYKNINDETIKEAFLEHHALIIRIRTKDNYWNSIPKEYIEKWKEKYMCSVLSGRYHLSVRIEETNEILMTLKDIMAYKFGEVVDNDKDEVNIVRRLLAEKKVDYLNERILKDINVENTSLTGETEQDIEIPEYTSDDFPILSKLEELHKLVEKKNDTGDLQTYIEKLENIYYMQYELLGNPDTHISCKMFAEYFEAFLSGLEMTLKLVGEKDLEELNDDFIGHITDSLKVGLRYMTQFADIMCSVNTTTFQAPKYEIIQDMNASPKFVIAYTEFLREKVNDYRKTYVETVEEERDIFPYYIPLVIPQMTEVSQNFYMGILYAQGFTDDWEKESESWRSYIESQMKTPLFVICQKYKMFANVSDVLTLSFHELGHYYNYITREKRNTDLLKMIAKGISGKIVEEFRDARETEHFLNRSETISSGRIKNFQVLNISIENALFDFLENEVKMLIDAPSELFIFYIKYRIKWLFAPKPAYYDAEQLRENALNFVIDKIKYNFGNEQLDFERLNEASFQEKGEYICSYAFEQCKQELEVILGKIQDLEKKAGDSYKICFYNFKDIIKKYLDLVIKALVDYMKDKNSDKYANELGEMDRKIRHDQKEIKRSEVNHVYTSVEREFFRNLNILFDQIFQVQIMMREYDLLRRCFFDNPQICMFSDANLHKKREELLKRIFQDMVSYAQDSMSSSYPGFLPTLWEMQMLERLQLLGNIELKRFRQMMEDTFFRLRGVDEVIDILSKIYSESFADLSMCKELNLSLKEYLIVIAKFVDFECKPGNNYRLFSIIIIVLIKMIEDEEDLKSWDDYYINNTGKSLKKKFIGIKHSFFGEKAVAKYGEFNSSNIFAEKFTLLLEYIEDNIKNVARNITLYPLMNRMIECYIKKEKKKIPENDEIGFVKKSLHYYWDESFNATTVSKKDILTDEIEFVVKYYYKNRNRYMKGETEND